MPVPRPAPRPPAAAPRSTAPAPPPTLADIARAAEVSTATVSHALTGTGRIAPGTRRRVRELAAALGYAGPRPGRAATRTLGLAVTTHAGADWDYASVAYFGRVLTAAASAAHARGYALTVLPAARGADPLWHDLAVDGMLLLDTPAHDPVLAALRARGLPLVFDGRPPQPRPGDVWVDNDHRETAHRVLDHLAAGGAVRPALHAGFGEENYSRAVTAAYREWCAARGARPLVIPFRPEDEEGRAFDAALTRPVGERPDAVYAVYDPGGRQLLAAARRHGLRVPGELLLVCASEDEEYARDGGPDRPAVSTVSFGPERIAREAVAALIALVERGPGPAPRALLLPATLHPRASSTPVPPPRPRHRPGHRG
ncbi:LacI family DNA-binding transcriptional regulator [Streptomyces sp. BI20]|uniref:LacI family DNA-binding transcriptional regulator n=1 Tax=Streptomyces sp. BI20 TaxID=3403460 RepID=UPI003C7600AA